MSSNGLLESLLNDSSLNLSQIKSFYSSLEEYQINFCTIDNSGSLSRAFSVIGNQKLTNWHYYKIPLEKCEVQNETSFGDFVNFPTPKIPLTIAIEEFGSCEIDEKCFIQEVIHESNIYNETWLQA